MKLCKHANYACEHDKQGTCTWALHGITADCKHDEVGVKSENFKRFRPHEEVAAATTSALDTQVGVKFDTGKPRYDLLPPEALDGLAKVLTFGAQKYDARNWEKGMEWGRVFGALQRHMWAWWQGEGADPETGLSHLHHAACCIAFLQTYEARATGTDDRP